MRLIICKNYDEVSEKAAEFVRSQVMLKANSVLGLATGSTPLGMYERLCLMKESGEVDFSGVTTFNLDEYYPIAPDNEQSYHYYMKKNFFDRAGVPEENIHIPSGSTLDAEEECRRYDEAIKKAGGIDLQILGIGRNGHIGFNEPNENLDSRTHVVTLTENTIAANARFFEREEDVPRRAITMGMGSIMKSKMILLLVSGKAKHNALSGLLTEKINTENPSTVLNMHENAVIICDEEAYNG